MNRIITVIFLAFAFSSGAQKFNNPENLIYDPIGDRYFISNTVDGQIIKTNSNGLLQNFSHAKMGSHGLEIWNGHILALYRNKINVIDMQSGRTVKSISVDQANFLKDIVAADDDCFFISDFSERKIFKLKMTSLNNYELVDWLDT